MVTTPANPLTDAQLEQLKKDLMAELNLPPGEQYKSALFAAKTEYLGKVSKFLQEHDSGYRNDESKLDAKMKELGRKFDERIIPEALKGAKAGGDASAFKTKSGNPEMSAMTEAIGTGLDIAVPMTNSRILNTVYNLARRFGLEKIITAVTNWVSDWMSGSKPQEGKQQASAAAGMINAINSADISIGGMDAAFSLSGSGAYRELSAEAGRVLLNKGTTGGNPASSPDGSPLPGVPGSGLTH